MIKFHNIFSIFDSSIYMYVRYVHVKSFVHLKNFFFFQESGSLYGELFSAMSQHLSALFKKAHGLQVVSC